MMRKYGKIEYIFFWMVCLVCGTSAYRIFANNAEGTPHKMDRSIAAEKNNATRKAPDAGKLSEFEGNRPYYLGCKDENTKHDTNSNQIRIVGPFCLSQQNIDIMVTNTRTGYVAMVFNEDTEKKYSTDFIALEPGKNQIEVTTKNKDGKSLQQRLTVIRN